ncbi:MAG: pentapeptide repeat-containing protein [Parafilimonas terrae]|nr:pentapeptide repeat-containing protein [Parafilimonas terrae]
MSDSSPGTVAGTPEPRLRDLLARAGAGVPFAASGLDLSHLDCSRAALDALATDEAPAWRDAESGGLALARSDFARARLDGTDLGQANLRAASFAGAVGRSAKFSGAILEEADLGDTDLSGADFTHIVAGQVRLSGAMLEDAQFGHAAMRFADLSKALLDGANFAEADLWGTDFTGADADDTVFRGARLDEAKLGDTNLTQADFEGASLTKAILVDSRLRGANFTGAKLDGADFSGADLSDANLVRLNLATCRLRHARFAGAWLNGTRMQVEQLGGAVGEEVEGSFAAAQTSYLALEQNWKSIGDQDAASWAYKRGRRMGRHEAGKQARAAWAVRDHRGLARHGYRWIADRFVEWLCDYGESLSRITRAFVLLIVVFAVLYGITGGLFITDGPEAGPTYNPLDLMSYSALNMMTANPPEIGLKPTGRVTNLLVGLEGAAGIILMGLFGFVLGNRLRR